MEWNLCVGDYCLAHRLGTRSLELRLASWTMKTDWETEKAGDSAWGKQVGEMANRYTGLRRESSRCAVRQKCSVRFRKVRKIQERRFHSHRHSLGTRNIQGKGYIRR